MRTKATVRIVSVLALACVLALPGVARCMAKDGAGAGNASHSAPGSNEPVMLAITGFNYTDRPIDSFSVDGQGGGNVFVSSFESGGGGRTCCVRYRPGSKVRKVLVTWQTGGCYYHTRSTVSDEVFDNLHSFSHKQEVEVEPVVTNDPKVMEVHFYPDGSVQAAITAGESLPRLRLDASREERSRYPRCSNDKKPAA